jgi:hypothetical protein
VDNRPHLFPAWATLPYRGTRQRRVGVRRARSERVGGARTGWGWRGGTEWVWRSGIGWVWRAGNVWVGGGRAGWVRSARNGWMGRALDDVVEGCGGSGVVGHEGSLA